MDNPYANDPHPLVAFMQARAKESYPEPVTDGHLSITQQVLEKIKPMLPPHPIIADVGCGQGPALAWFKEQGFSLAFGLTNNQADYDACERAGYTVHLADMHDIGEVVGSIECDLIWARHVLEHSIAPFYVLHEFWRILKPGGLLYVECPSPLTSCNHWSNSNHYSVLTAEMWASLIVRAGFGLLQAFNIPLETPAGPDVYHGFICRRP